LPLFARAGAIVPMAQVDDATLNIGGKRSDGQAATALTLRVAAGTNQTSFDLYDDDGETYGYDHGQVAMTHLEQQLRAPMKRCASRRCREASRVWLTPGP
jgi:alpha-glucosidase (family GH31 glycosyl hydrolase)